MSRSIAAEFDTLARRSASAAAIVDGDLTFSYADLLRCSERLSSLLDQHQLAGQRIALVLPNSVAFVAAFLAVARIGGIVAPLNPDYRAQELEHYLGDLRAGAVLGTTENLGRLLELRDRLPLKPALLLLNEAGAGQTARAGDRLGPSAGAASEAPLLLLSTSGSTGPGKRVLRGHAQLLAEVETLQSIFATTPRDRFLGLAPFSHVNGLVRSMLTALLTGATLYPLRQFGPRAVLELITRERLTFFGGVPRMFALLAQAPRRVAADLSSLRILFSASAPLVAQDNLAFHQTYGRLVRQLYGSTETGTISYNDHPQLAEHLESVGRPLPGVRIAVLDEPGRELPADQEGELAVASPFAATCYEGNPAATAASFRGGWYLTGDLGTVDRDGYVTITGRKGLMINRGGYKVNPREVEAAIRAHPRVLDVAVTGVPTPHGDEAIHGFVVTSGPCSPEEIVLHCRERIADYKIPARIEFRASLPRTETGKLLRGDL